MNKKMLALPLIAIMLSLTTAVAVAHWVDNLYVVGQVQSGTLSACMDFAYTADSGKDWTCEPGLKNVKLLTKDIANTTVDWTCEYLTVTVNNGYPCYYNHVDFAVKNTGTIPWAPYMVAIWSDYTPTVYAYKSNEYVLLDLDGDQAPDLELRYIDSFGDQTDPGLPCDISFEFHLLNPIPQGAKCLSFHIQVFVVNWNEYASMLPPGTNPQ